MVKFGSNLGESTHRSGHQASGPVITVLICESRFETGDVYFPIIDHPPTSPCSGAHFKWNLTFLYVGFVLLPDSRLHVLSVAEEWVTLCAGGIVSVRHGLTQFDVNVVRRGAKGKDHGVFAEENKS